MEISKKQYGMYRNGKLAVAPFKGRLGFCLYNDATFSKGSCSQEQVHKLEETLKTLELSKVSFISPITMDQKDRDVIVSFVEQATKAQLKTTQIAIADVLLVAIDENKSYSSSAAIDKIREEMDSRSPCPDDQSALALAVCYAEKAS